MLLLPLLLLLAAPGLPAGERIRGSALLAGQRPRLATWGSGVRIRDAASGRVQAAGGGGREFAAAGCAAAFGAGADAGLVLQEGEGRGRLLWWPGPGAAFETLDEEAEMASCTGAELSGRQGVLVIHRHGQVRFYERGRARFREIYSFYTPSRQAGLITGDVDGDGRADILAGNYWIRGPREFHLPWRLFAVNTWFEQEDSARLRLAALGRAVVAAQAAMAPARISVFWPPANPEELWNEQPLAAAPPPARVSCLAVADFDGDGRADIAAGEDNGRASRLLVFFAGEAGYTPVAYAAGEALTGCHAVRRGGAIPELLVVHPGSIRWHKPPRRAAAGVVR